MPNKQLSGDTESTGRISDCKAQGGDLRSARRPAHKAAE